MPDDDDWKRRAHAALDRLRRAERRKTGCHLTADMVAALSVTVIGQTWNEPDDENEHS